MNPEDPWAAAASSGSAMSADVATSSAATTVAPGAAVVPSGAPSASAFDALSSPGADWLDSASSGGGLPVAEFDWMHPFQEALLPLNAWVDHGLAWFVDHFRPAFQGIRWPIDVVLGSVEGALKAAPAFLVIAVFVILGWQLVGRRMAGGALVSLVFVGLIGAWQEAMVTLALVLTAVFFCIVLGLPLGILLARNDRALSVFRPVLDAMQTTPAFVYLVPIVMLFGIGNVPGVVVTVIFALPPLIRLTNLGIRQVPSDLVEAANAFGASPRQLLLKVQIPLAIPSIMAGVNQTLMLALSMVVIASMIAVGGLGQMVLRGIGRLDMGLATVGGLSIVLLAVLLDRLTQAFGREREALKAHRWYNQGPVGLSLRLIARWRGEVEA
ncbi:MAG: glycine betaine/L-proline ABC transporter permease ProW [Deltaproteobacteria bacterium]|nr:glycine betaine/L-proline ABC transporter permease ProW [Deltaproteobacteria bacterium]